jgi:hypothetical protein
MTMSTHFTDRATVALEPHSVARLQRSTKSTDAPVGVNA